MILGDINSWLSSNQLIVTFVIMPTVSALAAWYSARRAVASARVERIHQSAIEIARYRQAWIDALRDDLAEHQSICLASRHPLNPDGVSKEKMYRLSELANRILLRVNPVDPDYEALSMALAMERKAVTDGDVPNPGTLPISQSILKREWERLKTDLRNDAVGHG